jgi:ATP-dependent Lon protease
VTVPVRSAETFSEQLGVLHPSHAAARRELSEWVHVWLAEAVGSHHVLLQGPAGCGKHHLATSLAECLRGRLEVAIAGSDAPRSAGNGLTIWIARDGTVPKAIPPGTPRVRVRGLAPSEKRVVYEVLVGEACRRHGTDAVKFRPDAVREAVLRGGDDEAGLRGAVRRLEKLGRTAAFETTQGRVLAGGDDWVAAALGAAAEPLPSKLPSGCVHAPVVSSLGGTMARIEAFACPGRGNTVVTGAGPLAHQSVLVARSRCAMLSDDLGYSLESLRDLDWHLNVVGPEGPKDGVSLGWPVLVAMVSQLRRTTIDAKVAFSGEITLSGEIRPVGGVVEKFLACERAAIGRFWVPRGNMAELSRLEVSVDCVALTAESDAAALREWGLLLAGDPS